MAGARAAMYRWLASLVSAPPTLESVRRLRRPDEAAFLGEALGDERLRAALAALARAGDPDEKALRDEYHALFVVPGARFVAPHESVHLDARELDDGTRQPGLLWGPSTLAAGAAYAEAGYQLAAGAGRLPDHIASELSFVAQLCQDEACALQAGDEAAVQAAARRQATFLERHLGRFAPPLCARLEAEAEAPYFRAVAALLRAFVAAEAAAAGALEAA